MRKEADLEVTDRIAVDVYADEEVIAAARHHAAYIRDETLIAADAEQWASTSLHVAFAASDSVDLDGHPARIARKACRRWNLRVLGCCRFICR